MPAFDMSTVPVGGSVGGTRGSQAAMQPPDADLVVRCQAGDLGAFNAIVERYQGRVFNLAARILGNRASAEDVTQETFI